MILHSSDDNKGDIKKLMDEEFQEYKAKEKEHIIKNQLEQEEEIEEEVEEEEDDDDFFTDVEDDDDDDDDKTIIASDTKDNDKGVKTALIKQIAQRVSRVSKRINKGKAPKKYSPSDYTPVKKKLTF